MDTALAPSDIVKATFVMKSGRSVRLTVRASEVFGVVDALKQPGETLFSIQDIYDNQLFMRGTSIYVDMIGIEKLDMTSADRT
jgi:hypothetical protein